LFVLTEVFVARLGKGGGWLHQRAGAKVDGLVDEFVDDVNIKTEFLFNLLRLLFLAGEGISDEANLKRKPVGGRRVLQVWSLGVVQPVELIDRVPE
jgi:hypothetical protein